MSSYLIDINADLGEGLNNESDLMPYLSSCNIACGGHAGDIITMTNVVRLAINNKVKIGAHPSFLDRANFGRAEMDISAADLYSSLTEQIKTLQQVLDNENTTLNHVKPHGALYNLAARDEKTAIVVIDVMKNISSEVKLYAPYKSIIAELADNEGVNVIYEAFADRNYNEDLSLVSRKKSNAILSKKNEVLHHVLTMIKYQKVKTINGAEVPVKASTFCVHSDTEKAHEILKYLSNELPKNEVKIL